MSIINIKKSRGRPPADTGAVMLRLPNTAIEALDKLSADEKDKPGRPEIIRRILLRYLQRKGALPKG